MQEGVSPGSTPVRIFDRKTAVAALLVSLIYFVDILWRSSRKPFWFDELFTVYLCRLPTMRQTWTAVQHGADFNPPLFYLLTRTSNALFGFSNVATRLPETIGVWTLCLCLFFFIARRCGRIAGFIGAVFPLLTIIQYYAYEARPHGITLGWCGLELLCWQRIMEGKAKLAWHLGFIAAMLGSVLTHVYAVYLFIPFALLELYTLLRLKRVHWSITSGMAIAFCIAMPIYLPLVRTFKAILAPASRSRGGFINSLLHSATDPLARSLFVLLLFVVLSAWVIAWDGEAKQSEVPGATARLRRQEVMLGCCFVFLPALGVAGTRLTHAAYVDRYFLSWLAGVSILLSVASIRLGIRSRGNWVLAACMALMLCQNLGAVLFDVWRGRDDDFVEPSSKLSLYPKPDTALAEDVYAWNVHPELPILDISFLTYIYLYHYAPADTVKRLYFGAASPTDSFLVSYQRLATWAHLPLQLQIISGFLDTHEHFYTYESLDPVSNGCITCQDIFLARGYALVSRADSIDGVISEYEKKMK